MAFEFFKKAVSVYLGVPGLLDSEEEKIKPLKRLLESESLSCKKCGSLSIPLYDSDNKYKCIKCEWQFSNTRHNIRSKMRRKSYNKCVDEMLL